MTQKYLRFHHFLRNQTVPLSRAIIVGRCATNCHKLTENPLGECCFPLEKSCEKRHCHVDIMGEGVRSDE